jgi:hypothetical protein
MKVLWILGKVIPLALLIALGGTGAYAQQEIDPDHFDSPITEPPDQPKSSQNHGSETRYDGHFALPYAVKCSGKQLGPGKYSVSLRSDGKVGHGVLKSKSQSIEITSVVHAQVLKRGADVVVVGSKGYVRTLSAIQIPGVNFVFDPISTLDNTFSSKKKHVEILPLTLMAFKGPGNRSSP